MNLRKDKWLENDKGEFIDYLKSCGNPDSIPFARKIINTEKPMLGINIPTLRKIAKEIAQGDFLGFLNLEIHDYYEIDLINGLLIIKLKDFSLQKERLLKYAKNADNWAEIDLIKLDYKKIPKDEYFAFSKQCTQSEHTFVRRLGVILLFACISNEDFENIKSILQPLKDDEEYYVNMAVAWLVCEMVIKIPHLAIDIVNSSFLNEFALRKTISKCSDSFRVSSETVDYLRKINKKA